MNIALLYHKWKDAENRFLALHANGGTINAYRTYSRV